MTDILEEIIAHKREEVKRFKEQLSEHDIHRMVEPLLDFRPASMATALRESSSGIIAEFKRRSPSKGWIKEEGKAEIIPLSYQQHGAAALSILTDEQFFGDGTIKFAQVTFIRKHFRLENTMKTWNSYFKKAVAAAAVSALAAVSLLGVQITAHHRPRVGTRSITRDTRRSRVGVCRVGARHVRH